MIESAAPERIDESSSGFHLDRVFVYQNNITGKVSTIHLTLRQLCRILCPSSNQSQTPTIRHLTADTNLLLQELDGTYSSDGWKPARSIPVLQEVVSWWYYCIQPITNAQSTPDTPEISPPVSARTLATVSRRFSASFNEVLLISSALTDSTWRQLSELPYLQLALQAFDDETRKDFPGGLSLSDPRVVDPPAIDTSDIQHELEAFLNATSTTSTISQKRTHHDDDEESYESDGGTRYIKDHRTGNWVHEALRALKSTTQNDIGTVLESNQANTKNDMVHSETVKKHAKKKAKFAAKNSRCWIYITGLPSDCTEKEIAERFSKAGLLDLDPQTQLPKVKLYRHKSGDVDVLPIMIGQPKGDASLCFARPESVSLAVTLFDGAPFRLLTVPNQNDVVRMSVQAAKFEQHGSEFDAERNRQMIISNAQRKIAKLATKQAVDWDEGEYNGRLTGGRKGLRTIVLKHSFDPSQIKCMTSEAEQDALFGALEEDLRAECEQFGVVEKITFFASNPEGITVVKFTQPGSASDAVFRFNGSSWKGRAIEACFWDGVTDYTVKEDETKDAKDMEIREEEFGNWLESQELPDELRLQTE